MEGRNAIIEAACRILINNILRQRRLEGNLPSRRAILLLLLLKESKAVINRIVDIDVIGHNLRLDTKLLPLLFCPNSL